MCFKSGKCTCDCNFFGRNNLSHHCLAIGIHLNCVPNIVKTYGGRNLSTISAATDSKNTGVKAPYPESDRYLQLKSWRIIPWRQIRLQMSQDQPVRPVDPPPSGPLVVKRIAGNIRKCAGCSKAIKSSVVGFESPDDQLYCFSRFERYHFFNKVTNAWQLVTSTRRYHLNPVCRKVSSKLPTDSSLIVTGSLRQLVMERFQYNLD